MVAAGLVMHTVCILMPCEFSPAPSRSLALDHCAAPPRNTPLRFPAPPSQHFIPRGRAPGRLSRRRGAATAGFRLHRAMSAGSGGLRRAPSGKRRPSQRRLNLRRGGSRRSVAAELPRDARAAEALYSMGIQDGSGAEERVREGVMGVQRDIISSLRLQGVEADDLARRFGVEGRHGLEALLEKSGMASVGEATADIVRRAEVRRRSLADPTASSAPAATPDAAAESTGAGSEGGHGGEGGGDAEAASGGAGGSGAVSPQAGRGPVVAATPWSCGFCGRAANSKYSAYCGDCGGLAPDIGEARTRAQTLFETADTAAAEGDLDVALSVLTEAAEECSTGLDQHGLAECLRLIGVTLSQSGNYGDAAAVLKQSAALSQSLHDFAGALDAAMSLGGVLLRQGQLGGAELAFVKAISLARECHAPVTFRDALCNCGAVLHKMGRFKDAALRFGDAMRFARQHRLCHPRFLATTCINLGQVNEAMGDMRGAVRYFRRAVAAANGVGKDVDDKDLALAARARSALGLVLLKLGEEDAGIAELRACIKDAERRGDRVELGEAAETLGGAYADVGRFEEAAAALGQALTLFRAVEDKVAETRVLVAMGKAMVGLGDAAGALETLRVAQRHASQRVDASLLCQIHAELGAALDAVGRTSAAIEEYRRQIAVARESGAKTREEREALRHLVDCYVRVGDYGDAMECVDTGVDFARDASDTAAEGAFLVQKAQVLALQRHTEDAVATLADAQRLLIAPNEHGRRPSGMDRDGAAMTLLLAHNLAERYLMEFAERDLARQRAAMVEKTQRRRASGAASIGGSAGSVEHIGASLEGIGEVKPPSAAASPENLSSGGAQAPGRRRQSKARSTSATPHQLAALVQSDIQKCIRLALQLDEAVPVPAWTDGDALVTALGARDWDPNTLVIEYRLCPDEPDGGCTGWIIQPSSQIVHMFSHVEELVRHDSMPASSPRGTGSETPQSTRSHKKHKRKYKHKSSRHDLESADGAGHGDGTGAAAAALHDLSACIARGSHVHTNWIAPLFRRFIEPLVLKIRSVTSTTARGQLHVVVIPNAKQRSVPWSALLSHSDELWAQLGSVRVAPSLAHLFSVHQRLDAFMPAPIPESAPEPVVAASVADILRSKLRKVRARRNSVAVVRSIGSGTAATGEVDDGTAQATVVASTTGGASGAQPGTPRVSDSAAAARTPLGRLGLRRSSTGSVRTLTLTPEPKKSEDCSLRVLGMSNPDGSATIAEAEVDAVLSSLRLDVDTIDAVHLKRSRVTHHDALHGMVGEDEEDGESRGSRSQGRSSGGATTSTAAASVAARAPMLARSTPRNNGRPMLFDYVHVACREQAVPSSLVLRKLDDDEGLAAKSLVAQAVGAARGLTASAGPATPSSEFDLDSPTRGSSFQLVTTKPMVDTDALALGDDGDVEVDQFAPAEPTSPVAEATGEELDGLADKLVSETGDGGTVGHSAVKAEPSARNDLVRIGTEEAWSTEPRIVSAAEIAVARAATQKRNSAPPRGERLSDARMAEEKGSATTPQCVVLSVSTAQLGGVAAEGFSLLAAALLEAGVPCVVTTLWKSDDSIADILLMIKMYEGIASTVVRRRIRNDGPRQTDTAEALLRAQRWLRGATLSDCELLLRGLEVGLASQAGRTPAVASVGSFRSVASFEPFRGASASKAAATTSAGSPPEKAALTPGTSPLQRAAMVRAASYSSTHGGESPVMPGEPRAGSPFDDAVSPLRRSGSVRSLLAQETEATPQFLLVVRRLLADFVAKHGTEKDGVPFSKPRYWAGFTVVGCG